MEYGQIALVLFLMVCGLPFSPCHSRDFTEETLTCESNPYVFRLYGYRHGFTSIRYGHVASQRAIHVWVSHLDTMCPTLSMTSFTLLNFEQLRSDRNSFWLRKWNISHLNIHFHRLRSYSAHVGLMFCVSSFL